MTTPIERVTAELADLIRTLAVVRGEILLASGKRSDHYFDLRRVSLHPRGSHLIGHAVFARARDWSFDTVGGLGYGAIPITIATMIAARDLGHDIPAVAIRKETKHHGLGRRTEGIDLAKRRVLLVEDTSTTGASSLNATEAVRSEDADVAGIMLLVDRGGSAAIAGAQIPVRTIFAADELL